MNIPTIPGLPPHPTQIAEQQRLAWLKESDPAAAAEQTAVEAAQKSTSLMPDSTKDTLRKLAGAMRKAAGLPDPSGATPSAAPAPAGSPAAPGKEATPPPKPQKTELPSPGPAGSPSEPGRRKAALVPPPPGTAPGLPTPAAQ